MLLGALAVYFGALFAIHLGDLPTSDDFYLLYKLEPYRNLNPLSLFAPSVETRILPPFYRPAVFMPYLLGDGINDSFAAAHLMVFATRIGGLWAFYYLAREFVGDSKLALWSSFCIFALHSSQVAPVFWVAAYGDCLATTMVTVSLLCILRAKRSASPKQAHLLMTAASVAFIIGLTGKEIGILTPLLACGWFLRDYRRFWPWLVGIGCCTLAYLLMRWSFAGSEGVQQWQLRYLPSSLSTVFSRTLWTLRDFDIMLVGKYCESPVLRVLALAVIAGIVATYSTIEIRARHFANTACMLALLVLPPILSGGFIHARYAFMPAVALAIICGTLINRFAKTETPRNIAVALTAAFCIFHAHMTWFEADLFKRAGVEAKQLVDLGRQTADTTQPVFIASLPYEIKACTFSIFCPFAYVSNALYPEWIARLAGNPEATMIPLTGHIAAKDLSQTPKVQCDRGVVKIEALPTVEATKPSVITNRQRPDWRPWVSRQSAEEGALTFAMKPSSYSAIYARTPAGYEKICP